MRTLPARSKHKPANRDGATAVEVALTLPIFAILLAGLMEFSHYFMVVHTLNAAARSGANLGSYAGVTNDAVITKVNGVVKGAFATSKATVIVKDASVFDTSTVDPDTLNYNSLPAINLSQAGTSDPFLVQVSVPYDDIAILPPWWIKNATVTGRAVMRHE
jgi:Flp pilus assembly protein TadG